MTDYDDRCRVCLHIFSKESERFDLLDKHSRLSKQFVACCGILEGDHPRYLCANCADITTEFYQFKQMFVKSRQTFGEVVEHHDVSDNSVEYDKDDEFRPNSVDKVNSDINSNVPVKLEDDEDEVEFPEDLLGFEEVGEVALAQQIDIFEQVDQGGEAQSTCLPQSSSDSEESLSADDSDLIEKTGLQKESSTIDDGASLLVPLQTSADMNVVHRVNKRKAHVKMPCQLCPKVCITKRTFDAHMRTHQGLKPYSCDREGCNKTFKSLGSLKHHTNRHDSSASFVCKEKDCGRSYVNSNTLQRHMWNEHWHEKPPPGHVCELCGKVMKSKTTLEIHKFTHKDKSEMPLACDYPNCIRRFLFSAQLDDHKKIHKSPFKCPHCGAIRATQNMLNKHINLHTKETEYPCKVCGKIFYSDSQMKIHNQKVHQRNRIFPCRFCSSVHRSADNRTYHEQKMHKSFFKCPHCDATKLTQELLDKHINLHTKEKTYPCEMCNKIYYTDAARKKHNWKWHRQDPPSLKCPHCEATKTTQHLLNLHINLHTKEKEYPCEMCDKIFYSDAQRKTHNWNIHHEHQSYRCRFCSFICKTASIRLLHEQRHDGRIPLKVRKKPHYGPKIHECQECDRKYQHIASLRAHMKKCHTEASESTLVELSIEITNSL